MLEHVHVEDISQNRFVVFFFSRFFVALLLTMQLCFFFCLCRFPMVFAAGLFPHERMMAWAANSSGGRKPQRIFGRPKSARKRGKRFPSSFFERIRGGEM